MFLCLSDKSYIFNILANSKSGSSGAAEIISQKRGILHPLQVFELESHGPQEALQWAIYAAPATCRILAAVWHM